MATTASQQVCWVAVLEFVQRRGIDPQTVLLAGTPQWNDLPDDHPDKLGAVLAAGVHHALRLDCGQTALACASREISTAAAWSRIGRDRGRAYIPRHKEIA